MKSKYLTGANNRLAGVRNILGGTAGGRATALAAFARRLKTCADVSQKSLEKELGVVQLRSGYYQLSMIRDLRSMPGRLESMRMAVNDHRTMFKERYPKADTYLTRIAARPSPWKV